jgi:hypothetical protein
MSWTTSLFSFRTYLVSPSIWFHEQDVFGRTLIPILQVLIRTDKSLAALVAGSARWTTAPRRHRFQSCIGIAGSRERGAISVHGQFCDRSSAATWFAWARRGTDQINAEKLQRNCKLHKCAEPWPTRRASSDRARYRRLIRVPIGMRNSLATSW